MMLAVVKDGKARFYIAGQGTLDQWGEIRIPEGVTHEGVAILGMNLLHSLTEGGLEMEPLPALPPAQEEEPRRPGRPPASANGHFFSSEDMLAFIKSHDPMTTEELRDAIRQPPKTVSNRVSYLARFKRIQQNTRGQWIPSALSEPRFNWTAQDVLELIQREPGLTRTVLRERTGLSIQTIGNRISKLTQNGQIELRHEPGMRYGTHWPITTGDAQESASL